MLKLSFIFFLFLFSTTCSLSFSISSPNSIIKNNKINPNNIHSLTSSSLSSHNNDQTFLSFYSKSSSNTILNSSKSSSSSNNISSPNTISSLPKKKSINQILLSSWGILQVFCILFNGMRKLFKPALSPFIQLINENGKTQSIKLLDLSKTYWISYVTFILFMIYFEGYLTFYKKVGKRIVNRSFELYDKIKITSIKINKINDNKNIQSNYYKKKEIFILFLTNISRILLSGLYCMSMFDDTNYNMKKSWLFAIFLASLTYILKKISLTYRSIIDAGAICGLSVGILSIFIHYIKRIYNNESTNE